MTLNSLNVSPFLQAVGTPKSDLANQSIAKQNVLQRHNPKDSLSAFEQCNTLVEVTKPNLAIYFLL